jgi:hypothetical protein
VHRYRDTGVIIIIVIANVLPSLTFIRNCINLETTYTKKDSAEFIILAAVLLFRYVLGCEKELNDKEKATRKHDRH